MRAKTVAALAAAAPVIAGGRYAYGATAAAPIASTTIASLTWGR